MQHDYREIYGWMAEGKDVQVVMDNWTTCSQEGLLRHMLNGLAPQHFRLKPHTVKIGSREVEAPVLEPEDGQVVFRAVEDEDFAERVEYCEHYRRIAQEGCYFLSGEAALAARAAIHALLRGEA